ncbi:MAG: hypothetical protein LAP21_17745 [Acidobacteriia bacterium]|nr:hypothetical protein [Terriglobia bacterium]
MRKTAIRLQGGFIVLFLILASGRAVPAQTSANSGAKPRKVFINLTGDEKSTHRLWMLLSFDLEDEGMAVATAKSGVDIMIDGRITRGPEKDNIRLGVIRMAVTSGNSARRFDSCASLSNGEEDAVDDLFDGEGKLQAGQIRSEYPAARTVRVDPASDLTASKKFAAEFRKSLEESGFSFVDSADADLTVKVALTPQKIAIETQTLHYEINVSERDGMHSSQQSGDSVVSAKLTEKPPALCPERLEDLSWLSQSDAFCGLAHETVMGIMGKKSKPAGTTRCHFTPR